MVELAEDDRFTIDCNDNDKLIYLLLLLSAGITGNKIPNRPDWLQKRFNLTIKSGKNGEISNSIQRLLQIFPKLYEQNFSGKSYLKLKKFEKYHNWIDGSSQGSAGQSQEQIRIDKIRIDNTMRPEIKIIYLFAYKKGVEEISQKAYINRNIRAARVLLSYPYEKIEETMDWLAKNADFKWTLETVAKYIDENLEDLNNRNKKARGEWQCQFGFWHKKGEKCGHTV